ncbi:hypothetical protein SI65_07714 [Aspergillus cristatus]|uniref:Spindle pole body component n=1 Tax=Aspergillus cristatus TaxID=573508 RepID=A0A1E3B734_ASPCR|nr:hypothetical protein SI65_07714 [Aspergillus cristatus]
MEDDYGIDPFSSENLWRLSRFTLQSLQPLEPLPWNEKLPDLEDGFFNNPAGLFDIEGDKLHQLDIFGNEIVVEPEQLLEPITDTSSESQFDEHATDHHDDIHKLDDDIGLLDRLNGDLSYKPPLQSWETYHNRSHREPVSAYFSESGAKGFDAALAHHSVKKKVNVAGRLVRSDVFFQALIRLGLGWGSAFFRYNVEAKTFEKALNNVRVSGVSLPMLNQVTNELLQCGTDMQRIRVFVRSTSTKKAKLSALSTFASTTAVIIYTLERQLASQSTQAVSILQIKSLFSRGGELVNALAGMVDAAEKVSSDAQVMSVIMQEAAYLSHRFGWIENLMREVVVRVTEPWLGHLEAWVGLRPETPVLNELLTSGKGFAMLERQEENGRVKTGPASQHYKYQSDEMPSFIPDGQALLIFESGRSLRFLRQSHPRHPLSNDMVRNTEPPRLRCADSWAGIERIQTKAHEYESLLRAEILKYNRGERINTNVVDGGNDLSNSGENDSGTLEGIYDLLDMEDQRTTGLLTGPDSLQKDKLGLLSSDVGQFEGLDGKFGPEMTFSLYLSFAPLLSSQALLIDFSCLHMLFKEHKIRNHLTLQWKYQLLGDGFFVSRLSHALFDPEMESGERKSGVVRSGVHTGLRLGSRDTWPPASSELRLVLIGLLTESYSAASGSGDMDDAQHHREKELPGGLSFAVRELTAEEITKCKDPNAIQALDFLRLQYKPPSVLEIIITQRSLDKYDRLFKHLLRLLRMVSIVKSIVRDSTARNSLSGDTHNVFQKFRIHAQHFVLTVSDYCFHVGVESTWKRFQDTLSRIEYCLDRGDIDSTIDAAHSVPRLRDYHEDILDEILFALFLSKRHAQAAKLLESIFGTVLVFAPISRMDSVKGVRQESEANVSHLYKTFRKQASAFVNYLRGLDGSTASAKSVGKAGATFASRLGPTGVFDYLLSRLDINGYY